MLAEIKGNLYERQGKAITNFEWTLPKPQSDLALETFKNPYNFDFLNVGNEALERDIEQAMILHVEKVLLELGQPERHFANYRRIRTGIGRKF